MPHNHSPRCCCGPHYDGAIVTSAKPCPSCVEHGELASLNSAPNIDGDQCPEESPSTGARCFLKSGHPGAHLPAECPSCHTADGHPHTDYCQMPNEHGDRPGLPAQPETVDLVGHLRAAVDRARDVRAAQAQTSQPAATTSQPPTHTRSTPRAGTCPSCYLDTDDTPALNCNRPDYHDRPSPLRSQSDTGDCPSCSHPLATPPGWGCATPHIHPPRQPSVTTHLR